MNTGSPKRTRSERVAALDLPPGFWARLVVPLWKESFWIRFALCAVAALVMWAGTGGWTPVFSYRAGYLPPRDIVARYAFEVPDPQRTEEVREQVRADVICVYQRDNHELDARLAALKNRVFQVIHAQSLSELDRSIWSEFRAAPSSSAAGTSAREAGVSGPLAEQTWFEQFRTALADDMDLSQFEQAISRAVAPYTEKGMIDRLEHGPLDGDQTVILVHDAKDPQYTEPVNVEDVLIARLTSTLQASLTEEFQAAKLSADSAALVARLVTQWFSNRKLPSTLTMDRAATDQARQEALAEVKDVVVEYQPGDKLVPAGRALGPDEIRLLRREHQQWRDQRTAASVLWYSLAGLGMYVALYILCGFYLFFHERRILDQLPRLVSLLSLVVLTVLLCRLGSRDGFRAEVIPLSLFGMTLAIAYHRELALMLTAAVGLVVTVALGQSLGEFVILEAAVVASILMLNRIRSRTKLIHVGLVAGLVALLTTLGVGTMAGQAFGISVEPRTFWTDIPAPLEEASFQIRLLFGALWYGFCTLLAGLLLTALLPFVEKVFDVQTDLSLLELGDAAHPLLQELARRAPGTYNHSINVASLAESAAEAIHANALLVRVGAYFHDIGKMFKAEYFVENQSQGSNCHDTLMPAMSTLVIIAHVKDGADLARKHHLPQTIIDFIEQHHGTTLVEYFFNEATKRSESNPDDAEVDETSFRYPGPKPQTKEAGVMMIADAVESASRTLVDPTPARIENLVHNLIMKKMLDSQFDECDLTLSDLSRIEDSLVKSITAVYHGRVKYPNQQTA